jgi:hypothetical protein
MTLVTFAVILIVVLAALYVFNHVLAPPRVVTIVANVVGVLVLFFCVLDLFGLMGLPFKLK